MKLILSEKETIQLEKYGSVEIQRNGFDIIVEKSPEWYDVPFQIVIINPYTSVKLKKECDKKWNKK